VGPQLGQKVAIWSGPGGFFHGENNKMPWFQMSAVLVDQTMPHNQHTLNSFRCG